MPVVAQAQSPAVQFRVPAGPLQTALPLFATQSGEQILYSTDLVAGRQSAGVSGALRTDQALTTLLQGTGLRARRTSPNTLVVYDPDARADATDEAVEIEDVVVTGSLIRGVADGPSPVVTVTRDEMDRNGRATVAQLLASLPQNFGGTANEGALGNGGDRSGTNSTYANGVNLRGLGSDATLVLINGRRLAGTGAKGDFVDVSTIPTAAVERVDILLDGASALYGADAVGGVVNIILRDDYDGAETRVRVGNTSDGASGEYSSLRAATQSDRFKAVIATSGYPELTRSMELPPFFRVSPDEGVPVGQMAGWGETGQGRFGAFSTSPENYVAQSPLFSVERLRTPTLLAEGDQENARMGALFSALYRLNREAALVTYYGEGHVYESPGNVRDLHARILDWLARYLGPPARLEPLRPALRPDLEHPEQQGPVGAGTP